MDNGFEKAVKFQICKLIFTIANRCVCIQLWNGSLEINKGLEKLWVRVHVRSLAYSLKRSPNEVYTSMKRVSKRKFIC